MNKKDNRNYRIFKVDHTAKCGLPKKTTMMRIFAKDDDDAYRQLKDYIKSANRKYKYYVEAWTPHVMIVDGKRYECDYLSEMLDIKAKSMPWYKRLYDWLVVEFNYLFVTKPIDAYYWCRDLVYLIKNKQQYSASWSIDDKLLELLKFNLPILKRSKYTLSWAMLEKAYLEKHPDKTVADAKKHFSENGSTKNLKKRAIELEHKLFDELIDDIRAYNYYMYWHDCIDPKDKEQVETDKKLRHTLPLIKGSYDSYDRTKLNALIDKHWNRIWETVRQYGREFND